MSQSMRQSTMASLRPFVHSISLVVDSPTKQLHENTNQSIILNDTFFSQTLLTLTTGFFLSGFSIKLGASNLLIGLLIAIPQLFQVLQLPGIYMVEKLQSKRQITFWGTLISRLFLLPLAFVAFLPDKTIALGVLVGIYALSSSIGALATCAWNSWIRDITSGAALGAFFSRKLSLAALVNLVLTLAGGYLLEWWIHVLSLPTLIGYSILFAVGISIGLIGVAPLRKMSEGEVMPPSIARQQPVSSVLQQVIASFRERNYSLLIRFMALWNFAINLAVPFFTIYALSELNGSIWMVTGFTLVAQISHFLMLKTWGRLADGFSNKSVLMVSAFGVLSCLFGWAVIANFRESLFIWPAIMLIQMVFGISAAGTTLASNNLALKLAPEGKTTACIAANSMISGLFAGLAPLLGGWLMDLFKAGHGPDFSRLLRFHPWFQINFWALFFMLACGLGLSSLLLLARIDEAGEVRKRVMVRALFGQRKPEAESLIIH